MAAIAGRAIEFEWNNAAVLGVREKGIALNGEPINVTSDEDSGRRKLLEVSAEDMVDITLSGVTKDTRLKTDWFAGTRTRTVTITWPNGDVLTGTFFLATLSMTGPYNDAETFEATLNSAGDFTFTPYS
jgi:predicted secreted protein